MYASDDEGYNGNEGQMGEIGYIGVGEEKESSVSPRLQQNSHSGQTGEGDIDRANDQSFSPGSQHSWKKLSFIPDEPRSDQTASQRSPSNSSEKFILPEIDGLLETVVRVDEKSTGWDTHDDQQEVVVPPPANTFPARSSMPPQGTVGQQDSGTRYWSFGLPKVFSGPKQPFATLSAVTDGLAKKKLANRLTLSNFLAGQPTQSPSVPDVHPDGDTVIPRETQPHVAPRPPRESFQEPVTYYSPNFLTLLAPKPKTSRRKPHPLTNSITPNQTISNATALDPEISCPSPSNNLSQITTADDFQASDSVRQNLAPHQRQPKGLWRRMTHRFAETWTGRTAEDSYTSLNPDTSMDALSVLEERISHAVPKSTGPDVPSAYHIMASPTLPLQLLDELTDSHGSLYSLPPPFPVNPDFTSEMAHRSAELEVQIEAVDPHMLTESQRATYIINDGDSFSRNSSTRKRQHRPRFISDTTGIRFNKKAFNLPSTRRKSAACPASSKGFSSPSSSNTSRTGDSLMDSTSSQALSGSSSEYPPKASNLVPRITHTGPSVESFHPKRPLGSSSSSSGSGYSGKRNSGPVGTTLSPTSLHHNPRMSTAMASSRSSGSVDYTHNLHRRSVMRGSVATSGSQGGASTASLAESTITSFRFTYPTPYYPTQPSHVLRPPSQSHTRTKSAHSRSSYRPGTDIYSEILSKGHRRPVNPPQSQLPSRQSQYISGGLVGPPPPTMARLSQSSTWDHPTLEGPSYIGVFPCERYSFRQSRFSSRVHQHPGVYPPDAYQHFPPGSLDTGRPSGIFPPYYVAPSGIGNNPRKHKFLRTWGRLNQNHPRWDGLDRLVDRILPPGVHTNLYKFFFVLGFVCPPCWWFATWCIPAPRDQVEITRESLRQRRLREWNKRMAQISVLIIPIIVIILLIHFKDYSNSPILYHDGPMHIEPSPVY
ncbi:hypothetical protein IWQ62_002812 [Dispira parvispora]|uniref:Uncharacterized protein n=1 Tax=Dispira parvispora TaxID=1520584 RepID=A0A9W8AQJ8_9FUNG|nr:hypothetical protein IWQ62_002812 [Dispira parvispora]